MIRSFLTRLLVIALCLFPAQSHAYWQSVAQQNAGEPDVTTTDQACLASSGATQTFTAKNFGGGKAGRILAVSINWSDSTLAGTAELTGVTIDANVMSRATRAVGDNQNSNSEIWYAQVTSGTVGDVVVTASSAVDGMTIAIYRLVNYSSKAPVSLQEQLRPRLPGLFLDMRRLQLRAAGRVTRPVYPTSPMTIQPLAALFCGASTALCSRAAAALRRRLAQQVIRR